MDEIKAAVGAVCAISAVRCVMGNITSPTRLRNQVMIIMDLLLAAVMAAVFMRGCSAFELPEISVYEYKAGEYESLYEEAIEARTASNICLVLQQQVEAAGISCEKIEAEVNISADGSIFINRVTVISGDFQAASEIIKASLGTETEVVNGIGEELL
ncbi:MAG: hypothetical protein NC093_06300 [Alistipes sp.]|nr:hypothetical protein [Alistipes sp.]